MLRFQITTFLGSLLCIVASANAAITNGIGFVSGDIEVVSAPFSVRNDSYESSMAIRVFLENEVAINEFAVNAVSPGLYDAYSDFEDQQFIPGGRVRSYLYHFDQIGNSSTELSGSVTFDQPILAVIARSRTLEDTDSQLGANGVLYPTVREGRQVEYQRTDDHDFFRWENDGRTLFTRMRVTTKFDQIRVITAVPEPSSLVLVVLMLLSSAACRKF